MNGKKAKALRKQVDYHPSDKRAYNPLVYKSQGAVRPTVVTTTRVNAPETTRAEYRAAKRNRVTS